MIGYKAKGIGSAEEGIQSLLDKLYVEGMSLVEGEKLALQCLKQVMEDSIKKNLVDLVVITTGETEFTRRSEEYKENLLSQLPERID